VSLLSWLCPLKLSLLHLDVSTIVPVLFLYSRLHAKYNDKDDDGGDDSDGWSDLDQNDDSDLDASDSDDNDSDDDSDEDEEAALQAELAKIRAEREAEKAMVDAEVSMAYRHEYFLTASALSNNILSVISFVGGRSGGSQDGGSCIDWQSLVGFRSGIWQAQETLE